MNFIEASRVLAMVNRGEIIEAAERLKLTGIWSNEEIASSIDSFEILFNMLKSELRRRAEGWRPGPNVPFSGRITMGSDDDFQAVDEWGQRWNVYRDERTEK